MSTRPVRILIPGVFLALSLAAQEPAPPTGPDPWAPDRAEPGSVDAIREHTTAPEFLPESVAYVPDSDTVPSPTEVLGHIAGAPDVLSRVADVHGYFNRLDGASDRVRVETIGASEEGRSILLAMISDAENLAGLERYREVTSRLADPRRTPREEMRRLAEEGKVFYWLLGGLHSTETGSPEMLMELAYRLAVSERPEIQEIRRNAIVLITPVVEPDGRDRQVDWYERHLKTRTIREWDDLRGIAGPPYWGHYVFHDNNRDGMQITQALTRAIHETFFQLYPQVIHDLHESVPLLYISTGHGPYNGAFDPVTINEWTQFGHNEAGALAAQGLPGVWVWGFWDGWWPGYLTSVANTHHSVGRFYETFGNSHPGTFERELTDRRYAGKPVTEVQWYRPWPPEKKLRWSLRNNTNYMQAGVLAALQYAARHRQELLENFWTKASRSLEKGRTEPPYAWVFPAEQRDPARLAYLVNQLRAHRIEVHRLTGNLALGKKTWPAGSYVVRMDQPYRGAAVNFLEEQKFPADEPNQPYDDVAWTWPLLYGVTGEPVADRAVLDAAMEPVTVTASPEGRVDGAGEIFLLRDTGQNALLQARILLGRHQVDAAEASFEAGGVTYPPGSWIVQALPEAVADVADRTGLSFTAVASMPDVRRHVVDLPRLALYHSWTDTQDAGWARYTLDREKIEHTSINDDDLKRGGLADRFDVILFPETRGSFANLVHGIDPQQGPLAYTKTAEFPSHGVPDASEDITGGMGFQGLMNLERFVRGGGVLVTMGNAGTLAVEGGLVRNVDRVPPGGFNTPGSELRARVLRPEHPVVYGYEELTSVFRGNGPLFDVPRRERARVVMQLGPKKAEEDEEKKDPDAQDQTVEVEEVDVETSPETGMEPPPAPAGEPKKEEEKPKENPRLVLSGFVRGEDVVNGKPAILDVPVGKGRIILFAFNPLHRYLTHSDFRLVWNVILNWNDLP
jgi:Zinc carboxypeptidase